MVPILIQGPLSGKVVSSIACGSHHSLALTNDGEVYGTLCVQNTFFDTSFDKLFFSQPGVRIIVVRSVSNFLSHYSYFFDHINAFNSNF